MRKVKDTWVYYRNIIGISWCAWGQYRMQREQDAYRRDAYALIARETRGLWPPNGGCFAFIPSLRWLSPNSHQLTTRGRRDEGRAVIKISIVASLRALKFEMLVVQFIRSRNAISNLEAVFFSIRTWNLNVTLILLFRQVALHFSSFFMLIWFNFYIYV